MPVLTFYAYRVVRHKRIALPSTITDYPTDWQHLKSLLQERAIKLYNEYHAAVAIMTLEQHLKGKYIVKTKQGTYEPTRVRYRRDIIWSGRIRFNPKTKGIIVDQCAFGPAIWLMSADYYEQERGIKYRSPPVIPKTLPKLGDPKGLLMDPSASRYADYSRQPRGPYDFSAEKQKRRKQYESPYEKAYLPQDLRIHEQEEQEKD